MPQFLVTSPEGKKFQVTAPEGATQADAIAYIQNNIGAAPVSEVPQQPRPQTAVPMPSDDRLNAGLAEQLNPLNILGIADEFGATFDAGTKYIGQRGARALGYDVPQQNFDERYSEALNQRRGNIAAAQEHLPAESIAANIGGIALTGGLGAGSAGLSTIANSLRTGGTLARIGKGMAAGGTSGAAYGFGAGEGDIGNRLESAGENAVLGTVLGGAIPATGAIARSIGKETSYAFKGLKAGDADSLKKVGSAIKQSSSSAYADMRNIGATFKNQTINNLLGKVEKDLLKTGKLNARLHGDTLSVLDDLKVSAKQGKLSLEELDQYRQLLSDTVRKNTSKIDGANPDALKARQAIESIDDLVENLKPNQLSKGGKPAVDALNKARSEWSRYKKYDRIATILDKSEGDANYIKRELKKLADDKRSGFNLKEKLALKEASRLSVTEGILKSLGKFGFDIGGATRLGNTALPVGGLLLGQPGLTIAGTIAREGQKAIAKGKVADLLKIIEQGGNVSAQQLSQLPQGQATKLLQKLRNTPLTANQASQAGAIRSRP
jgi:hypothetical protein